MNGIGDRVRIVSDEILSSNHYTLHKVRFAWKRGDGEWQESAREAYDRGNGAAILLFNRENRSVVLTRQFRLPTYLNGYREMLIEVAAGLLDDASPEERIAKEAEEETGYRPRNIRKVFETFMSPGAVTEKLHLFVGEYDAADRKGAGGGLAGEGEDIEVLQIAFSEAAAMMADGRICDAKTIILLQYAQLHIFA
ncbi:MAG TPA: NUDIX domain-containing protein [Rhizomicrobium sp.]|jgi:nudix-type nucleoside diphosphatase (YffH/AdpP family)|nr:NUDIX domain-containing protein [Rhizomicrobium sp.]